MTEKEQQNRLAAVNYERLMSKLALQREEDFTKVLNIKFFKFLNNNLSLETSCGSEPGTIDIELFLTNPETGRKVHITGDNVRV